MTRLLGRVRKKSTLPKTGLVDAMEPSGEDDAKDRQPEWQGSGLGREWDDRVGAGAAAASIVSSLVFELRPTGPVSPDVVSMVVLSSQRGNLSPKR